MARNRLEIILSGQVRDFNAKLKEAQNQADETFGAISSAAQSTGAAFGSLAIAGALLTKSFLDKSVEMAQFRGTLTAVMKDAGAADEALRKMVDFAANTPFDLPGVVGAGVKLTALKADVDRFLPLAGDLAAVFNRDIKDAADALGKSLAGSQDGLTQLADSFGIAKSEMIKFGAVAKGDGSISTAEKDLDKLRDALEKIIKSKYGGAMEAQSKTAAGAFANLSDAIDQLKASLGDEVAPVFAEIAKRLGDLVQKFDGLPSTTKNMIAWSVVVATAIGGIGLAAAGAVAAFGPLYSAVKGFAALNTSVTLFAGLEAGISASAQAAITGSGSMAAMTGATTATGAASAATTVSLRAMAAAMLTSPIGIVVALGAAAAGLVHWYGKTVDASKEMQIAEQHAADRFRESKEAITAAANALREYHGVVEAATAATVEEFKKAGKTDLDAAKAILAATEQRNEAYAKGDDARVKILSERIHVLYGVREALSGAHVAKMEAEAAAQAKEKAAIEASTKARELYEKRATAGFYETKTAQLDALDAVLQVMKKSDAEYEKLSLSRVKLAREVGEEETKAAEETRKNAVAAAMWELDKLKALGNDNFQQRKAALEKILQRDDLITEERKKLELELLEVERTIGEHKVAIAKKTAEKKLKAEQDAAKLRVDAAKTDRAEADQELDILKEKLDLGQDVTEQLKEQLQTRQKLTEEEIKAAAEADKIGKSAAEKASIDKQAQSAITMSRKDTARESDAIERKTDEKRKKSTLEALKLEEQLAEAKLKADKHVTRGDLNAHYKERLRISEEQLRLQAEIDAATAPPEEKARIQNQLELDLYNLRKKSTEELAAASAELEKAKKKAEDLNKTTFKGVQSLDDMIKDMSNLGGIRRRGANKAEGEEGVSDSGRNRAAGSLGVNPNEKVPEGPDYKTASERKGTKQSGGGSGNSGGMGVSKWDRERAESEKVARGEGGDGGVASQSLLAQLLAAVQKFHADVLTTAGKSGLKVQFVTPQGAPSDGWTYTSQQT